MRLRSSTVKTDTGEVTLNELAASKELTSAAKGGPWPVLGVLKAVA